MYSTPDIISCLMRLNILEEENHIFKSQLEDAIAALAPIRDWYVSDEEALDLPKVISHIVEDLQRDRKATLTTI